MEEEERQSRTTALIEKQIQEGRLNARNGERTLLIAFARAASKAQEIEKLLQDTVLGAEVANDTRNRSVDEIATKIDKLPLGRLQKKYFKTVGKDIHDQDFRKMFEKVNQQRIFLMHNFFKVFPVTKLNGNEEARIKLKEIDEILSIGCEVFSHAFVGAIALSMKIPPTKFREFLAFVVEERKKARKKLLPR